MLTNFFLLVLLKLKPYGIDNSLIYKLSYRLNFCQFLLAYFNITIIIKVFEDSWILKLLKDT